jgi:hypothetical protein
LELSIPWRCMGGAALRNKRQFGRGWDQKAIYGTSWSRKEIVATLKDGSEFDCVTLGYPGQLKFGATSDFSVSFWCNITNQVDDPPFLSNKDWIASMRG